MLRAGLRIFILGGDGCCATHSQVGCATAAAGWGVGLRILFWVGMGAGLPTARLAVPQLPLAVRLCLRLSAEKLVEAGAAQPRRLCQNAGLLLLLLGLLRALLFFRLV